MDNKLIAIRERKTCLMKNKLLFTTALVAAFSATNVLAEDRVVVSGSEETISGTFNNLTIKGENGGAVSNSGGEISVDGTFTSNSAKDGGAIYNGNYGIIDIITGFFGDNEADKDNGGRGGAIYNSGSGKINKISASFEGNSADKGGAISNAGTGNVGNDGNGTITISDSTFTNNTAGTGGGAIHNMSQAKMTITGSEFNNNLANQTGKDYGGGAIYNRGEITVSNTTFDGNEAQRGGAVHNVGDEVSSSANATLTNVTFTGNKAEIDGGAVFNGNHSVIKELTGTFTGNSVVHDEINSNHRGGAIYNTGTSTINKLSANFIDNTADKGGAISNAGTMTIENSNFSENTALVDGGAIHNTSKGNITFKGNNIFSGNRNANGFNDIYNNGTITVAEGSHLTLDGGISQYVNEEDSGFAPTGKIIFENGSHLTVKAGATKINNTVTNKGASMDMVFANGYNGGKYDLIVGNGTLDKEFEIRNKNNGLFTIRPIDDKAGTYDVVKKSTSEVAASTGANLNQANTITAITAGNASNATFNAVADKIGTLLQSSNAADVKTGVDAVTAMSPDVAPLVQKTSVETTNQVFNAVGTRLSGGSIRSASEGKASGDNIFERAAVWVQTLFNKSKLDDTSDAKGFDSDSTGVAFGAEKFVNDDVKVGVGYAFTNTDIDGFMRDTDVDTHTAIVYGEYKPSNWYVNGIANYSWSDYSENKNVAGIGVKADYDVETFGLQTMTGYDMDVNGVNVTPEAGLRYFHVKQDSYKDSAGNKISSDDADILTGVIGAKVNKDFALENGMNIRPEARFAVTYDLMDADNSSFVTLANGAAYNVEGESLDRFGMEFGAGVTAEVNDNVELSLGYEGKFREDYQDHTGLLNAKYKF